MAIVDVAKQIERLQVVLRNVDELVPDPKNSKEHGPRQIEMLCKMIETFGFTNPILLDGANGILAGHGRLQAAKKLRLKRVPTIDLAHLSEEDKRAYIIADNRSAEYDVVWNTDILLAELGDLAEGGYDLGLTGWTEEDMKRLLGEDAGSGGVLDEGEDEKAPAMTVPLLLELPRALYARWKLWRADRDDVAALEAALTELEKE